MARNIYRLRITSRQIQKAGSAMRAAENAADVLLSGMSMIVKHPETGEWGFLVAGSVVTGEPISLFAETVPGSIESFINQSEAGTIELIHVEL